VQDHVKLDHEVVKLQAEVGHLVSLISAIDARRLRASRNLLQKLLDPTRMEANSPQTSSGSHKAAPPKEGGQQQAQQETKDNAPTGYHLFTVAARPKMLALAAAKGFKTTSSQA